MPRDGSNTKRNRISVNVEDDINAAMEALAEAEGITPSELGRSMFITELERKDLLPESTIRRLAGVRD